MEINKKITMPVVTGIKMIEKEKKLQGINDMLPKCGNPKIGNKIFTGKAGRSGSFALNYKSLEELNG